MINLLVISDSPSMNSGLARITRDLVSRLYVDFKDQVNITQLGLNWNNGLSKDKLRRYEFPWNVVNMEDTEEWGAKDISRIMLDSALDGTEKIDLIFTVYDPGRMVSVARVAKLFGIPLWGYFPIDSYNVHEKISGPALEALETYQRVLAYGPFGLSVLKNSGPGLNIEGALPHGLDEEWFKEPDLSILESIGVPVNFLKADYLIGIVCTNQPRKDLGLAFQAISILKEKRKGEKINFWLHTDMQHGYWTIPQLALDFGFTDDLLVTDAEYSDEEMRALYGMCDLTVAPGAGEGFGFPIAESLAMGKPVVHGAFGGGADLVPFRWQPEPFGEHLAGSYGLVRPIYDPYFYADRIEEVLLESDEDWSAEYCRGSVANLNWHYLWPRWKGWFKSGFQGL